MIGQSSSANHEAVRGQSSFVIHHSALAARVRCAPCPMPFAFQSAIRNPQS
jgi:hypothetical protein